ncbi:MAG: prefoldin subunit alpha [Candidatus Aenigmarchaeota archaeon]|nr:prefoldin subunit alpha [Candidatus Aenigmarchaeota archaeon]
MSEEEIQKKYTEFQMLQQQFASFAENKSMVDQRIAEIMLTIDALQKLESTTAQSDTLMPLGSGVFVSGTVEDTKMVLVDVGARVYAKKSIADAVAVLDARKQELQQVEQELQTEMQHITTQAMTVEATLKKMVEESKKDE